MGFKPVRVIKFVFITVIFSSALIFNLSTAQAAYSAGTLVTMTNSARAQEGLGALLTNSALASAAFAKANDIIAKDYFAHNSPDGKTPWDFISEAGYNYTYAGENLSIGYNDASELFSAWMNSPTHRENILNPNFREIGIAVVSGEFQGTQTIVAVQEFGASQSTNSEQVSSNTVTPTPTPAPTEAVGASPTSTPTNQKNFDFIKDKSSFTPKSIFSGEEIEFKIVVSGEIKALESDVFSKKYNLLENGSVSGTGKEKTYVVKQKIEDVGSSDVKVIAKDASGNADTFSLGKLEVKSTVIAKNTTKGNSGLMAGFKESLKTNWVIYVLSFGLIVFLVASYFIYKKNKFSHTLAPWRF